MPAANYTTGTFAPRIGFGDDGVPVSDAGASYNAAQTVGNWQRVGNLVVVSGYVNVSNKGSPNPNHYVAIKNLPFPIANGYFYGDAKQWSGFSPSLAGMGFEIALDSDIPNGAWVFGNVSGSDWHYLQASEMAQNDGQFAFHFAYMTS